MASPARTGLTVLFGLGLLAVGLAMIIKQDVDLPAWARSPAASSPYGAILLTTTYLTYRAARGEDTTHTGNQFETHGSRRIAQVR